ncbi:MAG: hypothetical protein WAS54_07930 [Scrofimicrobium sp.]
MKSVGSKRLILAGAAIFAATSLMAGCTASEPAPESNEVQSAQSDDAGSADEEEPAWDDSARPSVMPLIAQELPELPFEIWAPGHSVGEQTQILNAQRAEYDGDKIVELGTAEAELPPNVLTLLTEGSGFGVGVDEDSSLPEVGIITPEEGFTSLSALPGIAAANYLADGVPYQTLSAFAADSSDRAVVWLAKGETDDVWSLMNWNREEGTLQELASSSSMSLGSAELSVRMESSPTLSTNGRYVLFSVLLPTATIDTAEPGSSFEDLEVPEDLGAEYSSALFRVALDAPGAAIYIGSEMRAQADPVYSRGVFMSPGQPLVFSGEQESQSGSGAEQANGWKSTIESVCGENSGDPCDTTPSLPVTWTDGETSYPIFIIRNGDRWNIASMSVSERYLVVSVESSVQGVEEVGTQRSGGWLLIWNLEASQLIAAIQTDSPAAPSAGKDLVVWADLPIIEESDGEEAQSGALAQNLAYLFEPAQSEDEKGSAYLLPAGPADSGPKVSGDILAVRTLGEDRVPTWTFLQWK